MKTVQDRRKMKIRIDGKYREIEVSRNLPETASALLRLIEYRYLFPERSIKHVEKNGKVLHPIKLNEIRDLKTVNIVTESSINMIEKQIELAVITLDTLLVSINRIVNDLETKKDLAKLYLNNILNSLEWTVKVVESGSKLLPIYDGLDEAIAKLEGNILKVDDSIFQGNTLEAKELLTEDLLNAITEWKEFLKGMIRFVKSASWETH